MSRKNNIVAVNGNEVTVKLQWYEFNQNNSGGRYVEDDVQGVTVFVQATSADEATAAIWGQLNHSYCECCGERWSTPWRDDEGKDFPEKYDNPIFATENSEPNGYSGSSVVLHFYDGHIEHHAFGNKPSGRLAEQFALLTKE